MCFYDLCPGLTSPRCDVHLSLNVKDNTNWVWITNRFWLQITAFRPYFQSSKESFEMKGEWTAMRFIIRTQSQTPEQRDCNVRAYLINYILYATTREKPWKALITCLWPPLYTACFMHSRCTGRYAVKWEHQLFIFNTKSNWISSRER